MATSRNRQFNLDASRPLYAGVGVVDLAVELARATASDVQARFSKIELEPRALRDQARAVVAGRVDDLQSDAKKLPGRVESFVNETVAEAGETYGDLASRGKHLVNRIRRQQATQDAQAAANTTVAKAKTTRTQTAKSAKSSSTAAGNSARSTSRTSKSEAKKTSSTARRNAKATRTSARKTASAAARATADGASKVGR